MILIQKIIAISMKSLSQSFHFICLLSVDLMKIFLFIKAFNSRRDKICNYIKGPNASIDARDFIARCKSFASCFKPFLQ